MAAPHFENLNVIWELPEDWCEWDHVEEMLNHLGRYLSGLNLAEQFVFVVTSHGDQVAMEHPNKVIVIQTSDEGHEIPDYVDNVFMIFKNYQPFVAAPKNLRVLPLGCNKDVPAFDLLPMTARGGDLFVIGRKEYRDDFFAAMNKAYPGNAGLVNGRLLAVEIETAPEFRKGVSPDDYGRTLVNTKIALSPRGVSHETFRTYEALRAGCVVIAARQLPSWFNEGWPVIEVDGWDGIESTVAALITDKDRLQEISDQSLAWWREKCSPEACAHYMAREISLRLIKK